MASKLERVDKQAFGRGFDGGESSASLVNVDGAPNCGEVFRTVRYNILAGDHLKESASILFVASTGREGTSTLLANFAINVAEAGERVVAVDGNLGNPALHRLLGVPKENGLSDLLKGKGGSQQVLKATRFENLSVITAGSANGAIPRPFESSAVEYLIKELKSGADWVLFDSPPVNNSLDGVALSARVDGVVLVLLAEKTRREVAQNAVDRLEVARAKMLGVVLNRRKMPIPRCIYCRL